MDINILVNTIILIVISIPYCLFIMFINKKKHKNDTRFINKIIFINPNEKSILCITLNLLFWFALFLSLILNILFLTNIVTMKNFIIAIDSFVYVLCLLNLWIFARKFL